VWSRVGPVPGAPLPRFALREVGAVALGLVVLLLALAGRYGYHRDELYFRQLSGSLTWGYVDQPPLTPLVARGALALLGDSVWALRVPAAVSAGVLALLLALLARELGGRRRAQVVAATGAAGATPLISGHILLTASIDWPLWVLTAWLVSRALLRDRPRAWLLAGLVAGAALYNKHLVLLLLLGLAVGLAAVGPRRVLASRWPWLAAGVACLVGSPNLVYQLLHGLPQLQMAGSLTGAAARWVFVPGQLLAVGPPAALVWGAGLVALWRSPRLRPVRAFGAAYLVAAVLLLLVAGQFYYTTGFLLVLFAVGAVVAEQWLEQAAGAARRLRTVRLYRLLVVNVVTSPWSRCRCCRCRSWPCRPCRC
jgi:4-amino-4-deoxy-L-arabinose transferase-like glycosyltransferase